MSNGFQNIASNDSKSISSVKSMLRSGQSVISRSSKFSVVQGIENDERSIIGSLRRLSSPYSQSFYSLQSFATNKSKRKGKGWSLSKSVLMPNEVDKITRKYSNIHMETKIGLQDENFSYEIKSDDDNSTVGSEDAKSINDEYVLGFMKISAQPSHDVLCQRVDTQKNAEIINMTEPCIIAEPLKLPPVITNDRTQQPMKKLFKGTKKFENSPYASSSKGRIRRSTSKNQ